MPDIRLFITDALEAGRSIALSEPQAHYVTHVMRLKVGAEMLVFNGQQGEWRAQIAAISKKGCRLELQAQSRPQKSEPDLWLAFAPIKRARIDLVIEKATELGASVLLPAQFRQRVAQLLRQEY